jgi:hypothetical protein
VPVRPRPGQRFYGEGQTVLNCGRLLPVSGARRVICASGKAVPCATFSSTSGATS